MDIQISKMNFILLILTISLILFVFCTFDVSRRWPSLVDAETSTIKNATQSTKCQNNSFVLNKTQNTSPKVLPPKILMVYNGKQHDIGNLFSSKYRAGSSFSQLQIPHERIISNIPNNSLIVINGSCLGFAIQNDPLTKTPSSLNVNVYNGQGYPLKVLSSIENSKSTFFTVNLNEGKYILLAVATWLPTEQKVTGYVEYSFMIDVINSK
jgi:hypothetical protein